MDVYNTILATVISSIVGGVVAVFVARFSRTKSERFADLLETVARAADLTAGQLVQKLAQIDALEKRMNSLEIKNTVLWTFAIELLETLHVNKIAPPPYPKELDTDPDLKKILIKYYPEEGK